MCETEGEICTVCGAPAEYAIEEEGGKTLYRCKRHVLLGFALVALLQSLVEHLGHRGADKKADKQVMLAESWDFGPSARCFTFFGAVEAPEEEFKESDLLRLLRRRKPIWEDGDYYGLTARAVRGPLPGTAVLSVRSGVGGWEEVGVVFWPLRFVAPGGSAEGIRYGLRKGELPPGTRIVERPVQAGTEKRGWSK